MRRFLSVHVTGADAHELLQRCLERLDPLPPGGVLGFVYATAAAADMLPPFLEGLQRHTPGVAWLGCCGEGVCSSARESYDEPAVSLLLTDIPATDFTLLSSRDDLFAQLPPTVVQWCEAHPDCFGLLHAVPTYMASSAFVGEIRHHAPQARINGGLSSGTGNYRHIENGVHLHGVSGVLIDPRQTILAAHSQGCTPISAPFHVDAARQNMVQRLDGRPALEVLRETVGEVLWRHPQRLGSYIFIGLPVGEGEDYMVRNLMGLDLEGGAIAVGDLVERHQQLRFCRRDGNSAQEDLVAMLQRLRAEVDGRTIRGGLYISCVGRGRNQFGGDSAELRLIREQLGDFPLAGFFANGEFYNGRLYSYTGVLTLFL